MTPQHSSSAANCFCAGDSVPPRTRLISLPARRDQHKVEPPGRTPSLCSRGARLLCYTIRVIVAAPDADATCANRRGVGPPRKYLPRKKIPADLRSLARAHTEMSVKVLAGIAQNSTSDAARVSAVALLFERGWGRAPQVAGADPDGPLVVEIIQRVREAK
jgi:hypothetical protein